MTFAGVDGEIAAPTLVVHGHGRQGRRPRATRRSSPSGSPARASSCFHGAGHLFFWEQPDAFVRIVDGVPRMSEHTIDRMLRDRARITPERVAIDEAGRAWTYAELDARSDELARRPRATASASRR